MSSRPLPMCSAEPARYEGTMAVLESLKDAGFIAKTWSLDGLFTLLYLKVTQ